MLDPRVGEFILALFTSQERAANVVGDLLEEMPPRGRFWFWAQVVRTTAWLLARQLAGAPVRLLLVWLAAEIVITLSTLIVWTLAVPAWHPIVPYLCAKLAIPFLVGLAAAAFSRGHEMSAGLVLGIIDLPTIVFLVYLNTHGHAIPWSAAFSSVTAFSFLSSAFLVRRQRMAPWPVPGR